MAVELAEIENMELRVQPLETLQFHSNNWDVWNDGKSTIPVDVCNFLKFVCMFIE